MAKVPFTGGKNAEGPKGTSGKFSRGTGGHTSRGNTPPAGNSTGSTSNKNTRVGGLSKRMTGANGRSGMPK